MITGKFNFKESTYNNIVIYLKRLCKNIFNKTIEKTDVKEFFNFNLVMNYINSNSVKETVRPTMLNTILNILKIYDGINPLLFLMYQNAFKNISMRVNENRLLHISKEELKNIVDTNKINEIREKMEEKIEKLDTQKYYPRIHIQYLIICLYSMFIPLRQQDWINTAVYEDSSKENNKEPNYIDLKNKKLIITKYKTENKYGTRKIDLPADLVKIIKHIHNLSQSKWLLPSAINIEKHITSSNLTHSLNRIFDHKISTSLLRKIYISKLKQDGASLDELKRVAKVMGHSLAQSYLIYGKFTDANPDFAEKQKTEDEKIYINKKVRIITNKKPFFSKDIYTIKNIYKPQNTSTIYYRLNEIKGYYCKEDLLDVI